MWRLPDLVAYTYEHAFDADLGGVLREAAQACGLQAVGLAFQVELHAGHPPHGFGVDPEQLAAYARYHVEDRIWNRAVGSTPVGKVAEVMPRAALERTMMYQEWLRPQHWGSVMQLRILEEAGTCAALLLGRSASRPFSRQDVALLERWVPHLRRALEIRREVDRVYAMAAVSVDVLDALPMSVVLVDPHAQPLHVNTAADELMAIATNGLTIRDRRLSLASREATRRLHAACARGGRAMITVPRPGQPPLELVVTPLPRSTRGQPAYPGALAVVIDDRQRTPHIAPRLLEALYRLTPGQASLAVLLVQGQSLESAAALLGLKIGTVRDRLKQIFARTGVHRQADLVRMILSGPASFRRLPPVATA